MTRTLNRSAYRVPTSLPQLLIFLGILLVILYTGFVALPFFQGPSLIVEDRKITENGTTVLRGSTARVSALTINDLPVPITEDGSFIVERVFPPGYTVVVLEARDRFGRMRTQQLTFITYSPYDYALKENSKKESPSQESDRESREEGSEN